MKTRFLSTFLCLTLLVGITPHVSAVSENDLRDEFVSYAASLKGSNGPSLGFGNSNWCVYFINYCAKNNGTNINSLFPDTGSVTASAKWFAERNRYYYFDDSYIPKNSDARKQGSPISMDTSMIEKGDLAYFISNSDSGFEHIGIVESVNSNGVTIIHGSWSNSVARTTVTFGKTIGQNYPVRFAGIAKPDYASMASNEDQDSTTSPTVTKTQYRYHHYVTADGRASLCPYYGESTYGAKLTLEYTEWLDQPLTRNSNPSGHSHVNQGKACTNAGCIDPSRSTERYTDGSSNWYYEETRTVTVEVPSTSTPEPPVTLPPEPTEVRYKVEHYLERTDAPGNYEEKPETVIIYSGKAGEQVTLYPTSFDGYQMPVGQSITLPSENATYRIYYDLASYTLHLSAEPGIASVEGNGVYHYGEQVILSAQVEDGYQWAGWSDGSMQQNGYRFTMPSKDLTLTARATPNDSFVSILPEKFPGTREWSVLQFDDISSWAWYYDNVKAAYRYDLMNGRGASKFAPDGTLTVAESITLAARIHAKYYGKTIPSYDGGAWYDGYVSYALQNGIYAEGPYNIPATREVFARILAAALPVEELWDNGSSINFADEDQIHYRSSVELLCQAGVINGTKRGSLTYFDPTDTITRAQAAAIVTRMVIPDIRTRS